MASYAQHVFSGRVGERQTIGLSIWIRNINEVISVKCEKVFKKTTFDCRVICPNKDLSFEKM
uniref:HDC05344 n=1 Tax=Drosophila melanogaster TaxID=7227 RepID=Q6IGT1_DROME|nr:TPA_inf: HDC05344 [Drosophila melanogaster]